jgi:hypothetical protein
MNKVINDLLTGKDNQTHDLGRWAWMLGFLTVIAIAIYEVYQARPISLTELASALGIISGAGGASVMMKSNTEPEGQ